MLKKEILRNDDRKYMVQTLATMMMSYVANPSTQDCLLVAKSLLAKFPFLKQDGSEVLIYIILSYVTYFITCVTQEAWKWFLYTRAHNVNRPNKESNGSPPKKLLKGENAQKHSYPDISSYSDDEVANARNMELLKQEADKDKPTYEVVKSLMTRTYPYRRQKILEATTTLSVSQMTEDLPVLKKWNYVSIILHVCG